MANFLTTMYNTNIESVEPPLLEEYEKVPLKTDAAKPKSVMLDQFHASVLSKKAEDAEHQRLAEANKVQERAPIAPYLSTPSNGATFDNYGRSYENYTSTFTVKAAGTNNTVESDSDDSGALRKPIWVTDPVSDASTKVVLSNYVDEGENIPEFVQREIKVDAHEELKNKPMSAPTLAMSTQELTFKDPKTVHMEQAPLINNMGAEVVDVSLGVEPEVTDIGENVLPITGLNIEPEVTDIGIDLLPLIGMNIEPEVTDIGENVVPIIGLNTEPEVTDIGENVLPTVGLNVDPKVIGIADDIKSTNGLNMSPTVEDIGDKIKPATGLNIKPEVTDIGTDVKQNPYKKLHTHQKYYENFVLLANQNVEGEAWDIKVPEYQYLRRYADVPLTGYRHKNNGRTRGYFVYSKRPTNIRTEFPVNSITAPWKDYTGFHKYYKKQKTVDFTYRGSRTGPIRVRYVYAKEASTTLTRRLRGHIDKLDTGFQDYYQDQKRTDFTYQRDLRDKTGVLTYVPKGKQTNDKLSADYIPRYNKNNVNKDGSYKWAEHRDSGVFTHSGYNGKEVFNQEGGVRATKYGQNSPIRSSTGVDKLGYDSVDNKMSGWYRGKTIEGWNLNPHPDAPEQLLTSPNNLDTNEKAFYDLNDDNGFYKYEETEAGRPKWQDREDVRTTRHTRSLGTAVSQWITGENQKDATKGIENPVYAALTHYDEQAMKAGYYDATGWGEFYCTNVSSIARDFLEYTGSMLGNIVQTMIDPVNYVFPFKKLWEPISSTALYQAYRLIPWYLVFMPRGEHIYSNTQLRLYSPILDYTSGRNFDAPPDTATYIGIKTETVASVKFDELGPNNFQTTYGPNHSYPPPIQNTDTDYDNFWDSQSPDLSRSTGNTLTKTYTAIGNDEIYYKADETQTLSDSYKLKNNRFKAYKSIRDLKSRSGVNDEGKFGTPVNFGTEFYWDILFDYPDNNKKYLPAMPYDGWIPVQSWNIMGTQMGTTSVETIAGSISIPDSYQLPSSIQITLPETSRYDVDTWMRAYFTAIFCPDQGGQSDPDKIPSLHILPYKNQTMYITIYWLTEQWMPVREKTFICIPEFKFQYNGTGDKALKTQDITFNIVGTRGFSHIDVKYAEAGKETDNIRVLE